MLFSFLFFIALYGSYVSVLEIIRFAKHNNPPSFWSPMIVCGLWVVLATDFNRLS